jgi:hypothetical protein
MYCEQCNALVCIKCLFTKEHRGHPSISVEEYTSNCITSLEEMKDSFSNQESILIEAQEKVKNDQTNMMESHDQIDQLLIKHFDEIINTATNRKEHLLEKSQKMRIEKRMFK